MFICLNFLNNALPQRNTVIAITTVILLAGCSSNSGNGETPENRPTFDELETDIDAMHRRWALTVGSTASLDDLPINGSASYEGYVALGLGNEIDVLDREQVDGELTVTANFASLSIDAEVKNLVGENLGEIGGTLTNATNGAIQEVAGIANLSTDLVGILDIDGDTAIFAGLLTGQWHGDESEFISGIVIGDVDYSNGFSESLGGIFIAEEQ